MLSWRAAARERPGSRVCKPFGRCDTWAPAYLRPSLPSPAPTRAQTMRQLRLRPCLPRLSRKPVSDKVSGLLTATTAAELPLEPLPRYRRSLTSSPPSLPFRLSPARAACVVGGPATAGTGAVAPPPRRFRRRALFRFPRDVRLLPWSSLSRLALGPSPGASFQTREVLQKLI